MMRDPRLRFGFVLVLALGVRLVNLAGRGIIYDDAFSIFLAGRSLQEIVSGTAADTMPPLFYFLLHYWMLVSQDLAWIRLLGILINLGCVGLAFLLTRRLFNSQAAFWAALLVAISPLQYYHAQDVRMYSLLAACQLGYAWLFARIWQTPGKSHLWDWLGMILFGTAALYTHNLAIFGLATIDLFLIIRLLLVRPRKRETAAAQARDEAEDAPLLGAYRASSSNLPGSQAPEEVEDAPLLRGYRTAATSPVSPAQSSMEPEETRLESATRKPQEAVPVRWRLLFQVILSQVIMGLFFAPWLVLVPGQLAKVQAAFWTPVPGLVEVLQAIVVSTTNLPLPGWLLAAGFGLSLFLFILIIWRLAARARNWNKGYLAALALLPPVLLFAISYLIRPVFVPRGFIFSTVVYLILAGVVIAQEGRKAAAWIVAGGFILAALAGVGVQAGFAEFPRSPFQKAAQILQTETGPGDVVIHDNKLSYFPVRYYAPDLNEKFLADIPGSANDTYAPQSQAAMQIFPAASLPDAIGSNDFVFFVIFQETISEYNNIGRPDPNLNWLRQNYREMNRVTLGDLLIYEFERSE